MKNFIKNHFDFNFYLSALPSIICLLVITPCVLYLPANFGYENGVIENIQMTVLLIAFILCLKAKNNKKLFIFAALVVLLLALREVNYGRTLFFPIPNQENMFYSWKEIKYGYLVHPAIFIYILGSAIYFFINKLYINLWKIITNVKVPVMDTGLLFTGVFLGILAEKFTNNFVFEEMAELLFYLAFSSIIYLYAFKKEKTI